MEFPLTLEQASIAIGIAVAAVGLLGTIFGWFGQAWRWAAGLFTRKPQQGTIVVPKETVRLVPGRGPRSSWWHMGSMDNKPAMQLSAHFIVTNITHGDVLVVSARVRKPKTVGIVATRAHEENIYGQYPIPAANVSELSLSFWIQPPVRKEGQPFTADLVVVDHFGNEHTVRRVEFDYR